MNNMTLIAMKISIFAHCHTYILNSFWSYFIPNLQLISMYYPFDDFRSNKILVCFKMRDKYFVEPFVFVIFFFISLPIKKYGRQIS